MAEGSSALSEILLPVVSTWERFRQSPSGCHGPTMSVRVSAPRGGRVGSRTAGNGAGQNEGEGPG
jgi:hypothetical protein